MKRKASMMDAPSPPSDSPNQYYANLCSAIPSGSPSTALSIDGSSGDWDIRGEVPKGDEVKRENSVHGTVGVEIFKSFKKTLETREFTAIHDAEEIGWAIFSKGEVKLEIMFEMSESLIDQSPKKSFGGFERPPQVPVVIMVPKWHCSGFPAGVISLLVGSQRIPLHYIDFKFDVEPACYYAQLVAYLYQGLCFARAAQDITSVSGSMISYTAMGILGSSYDLRLTPDGEFIATRRAFNSGYLPEWTDKIVQFISPRFNKPPIVREMVLHRLLEWPDVVRLAKAKGLPMPDNDKVAALVSSQRCTIYKCDGYFYKLVHAPHLDEDFIAKQMKQYKYARNWVQEHEPHQFLPEMNVSLLAKCLALVVSKDAGTELILPLATQLATARLLDVLLAFCLIPPLEEEEKSEEVIDESFNEVPGALAADRAAVDIVHGDLRVSNLTETNCIIDFEFLGFTEPRVLIENVNQETLNPELCPEQSLEGAKTLFTNVWQCGLIVFQMMGAELESPIRTRHIVERAQKADEEEVLPSLSPEFFSLLVQCRKELCSMEVFRIGHTQQQKHDMREKLRKMRLDLAKFLVAV